jgi:sulfhydrogenase subunit beta (sulfur reductase)
MLYYINNMKKGEDKMQKILLKKDFNSFVENLIKNYEVIAPVNKDITKFDVIKSPKEIYLKKITQVPVKKLFFPENELIFEFKNNRFIEPKDKIKNRIIFGLRLCDINALEVLDKVMSDKLYINKRKNTILIGFYCENPDKYCFCNSMGLKDEGYDLFFYPDKDKYYITVNSDIGKKLTKNLKNANKTIKKELINTKKLKVTDLDRHYKNKIWESDANKCLSCSACTVYCPTCNCFDIKDKLNINLKDGIRTRSEMSCQLKSFSRIAGGKSFRDSRLSRFKHFVYHKIVYYKRKKERYMCVGCGRCLRVCPTKIDWVKTINVLEGMKHPINDIKETNKLIKLKKVKK